MKNCVKTNILGVFYVKKIYYFYAHAIHSEPYGRSVFQRIRGEMESRIIKLLKMENKENRMATFFFY